MHDQPHLTVEEGRVVAVGDRWERMVAGKPFVASCTVTVDQDMVESCSGPEAADSLTYASFGDAGTREFFTHVRFHKHDEDRIISTSWSSSTPAPRRRRSRCSRRPPAARSRSPRSPRSRARRRTRTAKRTNAAPALLQALVAVGEGARSRGASAPEAMAGFSRAGVRRRARGRCRAAQRPGRRLPWRRARSRPAGSPPRSCSRPSSSASSLYPFMEDNEVGRALSSASSGSLVLGLVSSWPCAARPSWTWFALLRSASPPPSSLLIQAISLATSALPVLVCARGPPLLLRGRRADRVHARGPRDHARRVWRHVHPRGLGVRIYVHAYARRSSRGASPPRSTPRRTAAGWSCCS